MDLFITLIVGAGVAIIFLIGITAIAFPSKNKSAAERDLDDDEQTNWIIENNQINIKDTEKATTDDKD